MSVLAAFGVVDRAPLQVSDALKELNMSHTYTWRQGVRVNSTHIDGLALEQPVWPIVVDSLRTLSKIKVHGRYVFLVVDSRAALANANLSGHLWPEHQTGSFTNTLKRALIESKTAQCCWELESREPSLMDYVNTATKPSQLNNIQTLLYKITPYALRKEVQALCISYIAGTTSAQSLKTKLKSNLKFAQLLELMFQEKTTKYRDACILARTVPMPQVVKDTGYQSFEIMYVLKSAENHKNKS
jgi:hypothetical protein